MYCSVEFGERTRRCGLCKGSITRKTEVHLRINLTGRIGNVCHKCLTGLINKANYLLPKETK